MIQPTSSIWKSLAVLLLSLAAVVVALGFSHAPSFCFHCSYAYNFSGDPFNPWGLATLAFVAVLVVRPLISKQKSLRADDVSDEA